MKECGYGRIVNMSSYGHYWQPIPADMSDQSWTSWNDPRTRDRLAKFGITVNAVAPSCSL